jgi:hypothetical protein
MSGDLDLSGDFYCLELYGAMKTESAYLTAWILFLR